MKTGFEKKINRLTLQLHDTQDKIDLLFEFKTKT